MSWFEIVTLGLNVFGIIMMPLLVYMLKKQNEERRALFKHIDECIDKAHQRITELSDKLIGSVATKGDLEKVQIRSVNDVSMERLERERATEGLHARIMRLEDIQLQRANRREE